MRRLPSSWSNQFLARLGYRRIRSPRQNHGRRSSFEALERREMLSGTAVDDSLDNMVVVAAPTGGVGIPLLLRPTYVLASETRADGAPSDQFVVRTEYSTGGSPRAVVSLRDGLTQIDDTLHTLQLELRLGGSVLERQGVLIDIESTSFREQFLRDRLTRAEGELVSAEPIATDILGGSLIRLDQSESAPADVAISQESLEQLTSIAKSVHADPCAPHDNPCSI